MPGTNPAEAMRVVAGELPDFPYLPELPDRGPGADLTGRTAALLVEIPVEVTPRGWRLAERPGRPGEAGPVMVIRHMSSLEPPGGKPATSATRTAPRPSSWDIRAWPSPLEHSEGRAVVGELLLSAVDCYAAARLPAEWTCKYRPRRPKPVSRRVALDIMLCASSAREYKRSSRRTSWAATHSAESFP